VAGNVVIAIFAGNPSRQNLGINSFVENVGNKATRLCLANGFLVFLTNIRLSSDTIE
jgi:hypothetical protein